MTEHRKIPLVPPISSEVTANRGDGNSSIERAVETFDLRQFLPPAVPEVLPAVTPRLANRARRLHIDELGADLSGLAASPLPGVDKAAEGAEVIEASSAVVTSPTRMPRLPAVDFKGVRHPIDRTRLREQGMIVPEGTNTGLLEEFRIVKRQVLLMAAQLREADRDDPKAQRVLVCSPLPGEGKTYCAVNLALSMAAEKEAEVLLVDADFAKPSVLSTLGLPGGPGLMDALVDPTLDVADLVLGTDVPGLCVNRPAILTPVLG